MLHTITVEESTLVLLRKLQQVPLLSNLRLVGGTALALHIGHRHSIDLDFFGVIDANGIQIASVLRENGFEVAIKYDIKTVKVFFVNNVKVDMVNYPYDWIDPLIDTDGIRIAGLKDIAAMKLAAITNRGTKKDFVDIYFLLQHFSLKQMIGLYKQKYSDGSVLNVMRSLTYFDDAEDNVSPRMIIPIEWEDIKSTIRTEIANY
jgi:predicted nucleotidyltransferase component of viral defense system